MSELLRITHTTEYFYREPVIFGPHAAMLRPREGHDLHIQRGRFEISPEAKVRWMRDVYDNSVAVLTFLAPAGRLRVHSEVDVLLFSDEVLDCPVDATATHFPFFYSPEDQVEVGSYRLPSYPHNSGTMISWLRELYEPGQCIPTRQLLHRLNSRIHDTLRYEHRDEPGVQTPGETLAQGSGSCRDYAVLMMEAARSWGMAARFVTGYVRMEAGQHGSTHAWTEVYLPGAGWLGYDPTNNKLAGREHVPAGVAREQEKAAPLTGTWSGPAGAYDRMEVIVRVEAV